MRTLLLDSTYFPVKVINWQKAMILLVTGRAELVDAYENIDIRSTTNSFKLPRILRLFRKHQSSKTVKFTRYNIFWRDKFKCQYCYQRFPMKNLTFDHVIPVSRGGKTTWENIVSACHPCNMRKGSKTPEEANLKLLTRPIVPGWSPQLCLKLKDDDPEEWSQWVPQAKVV